MAYGDFGTLRHSGSRDGGPRDDSQLRDVAAAINWIIWIAFIVEFGSDGPTRGHLRSLARRGSTLC